MAFKPDLALNGKRIISDIFFPLGAFACSYFLLFAADCLRLLINIICYCLLATARLWLCLLQHVVWMHVLL